MLVAATGGADRGDTLEGVGDVTREVVHLALVGAAEEADSGGQAAAGRGLEDSPVAAGHRAPAAEQWPVAGAEIARRHRHVHVGEPAGELLELVHEGGEVRNSKASLLDMFGFAQPC